MLMLSKAISFRESPTLHGPQPILSSLPKPVPVFLPLKLSQNLKATPLPVAPWSWLYCKMQFFLLTVVNSSITIHYLLSVASKH